MKTLLSILFSVLIKAALATHIVGGGFNLQRISGNTYRLNLVVYRDCTSQTDFNHNVYVGIYDKLTNTRMDSIGMPLGTVTKINPAMPQCAVQVPGCTEKAEYTRVITLSPLEYNNTAGYYISWERCCRNSIIQNIQQPGNASMAFYAEIPSPAIYVNSTPRLINNPFTVLCVDNLFTYNIQFADADGDSLVYQLVTPINGTLGRDNPNDDKSGQPPILNAGPYDLINWLTGYSNNAEILGNPPLSINYKTGQLKVRPTTAGVFVVAMSVTEYRNGVAIGVVHLELQFLVVNCVSNDFPTVKLFQNGNAIADDTLYVTIPDTLNFALSLFDKDGIDTSTFETTLDTSEYQYLSVWATKPANAINYNMQWRTHCGINTDSVYKFTATATDKGCPIYKTSERVVWVKVKPMPLLPPTDVLCIELQNNKSCLVYFGDSARHKPHFKQYNIYRASGNNVFQRIDIIKDHFAGSYLDLNAPNYNQINYRYLIKVENDCGTEGLPSDTLGTFDQLKYLPDKQYLYNVTVKDDKVLLTWNQTKELDFARYFLWKGYRNQAPTEYVMELDFLKQTDTVYLDNKVQVNDTSHCYYLVMLDTCGNYGPLGQVFCTTVLRGAAKPFKNTLNWQPFVKSDEFPVSYDLRKFALSTVGPIAVGTYDDATFTATDLSFNTDDGRYIYEVDVLHTPVGWTGVQARSTSNKVELTQKPYIFVPNAFSPNLDAINDTWNIVDVFVKDYTLKVYNRWGGLVFETTDKNQKWTGKDLNNNDVPTDVYVYLITYTGWQNEVGTEKGNVTILR
jgi:gliding motility-associated-like protein